MSQHAVGVSSDVCRGLEEGEDGLDAVNLVLARPCHCRPKWPRRADRN